MAGIGSLETIALDCPDARALAAFYQEVVGWEVAPDSDDDWVTLRNPNGGLHLAFQRVETYVAPEWPSAQQPQQAHLDIYVDDLDKAESAAIELGARKAEHQPGTSFRVFLDPAGHPFCLCQN